MQHSNFITLPAGSIKVYIGNASFNGGGGGGGGGNSSEILQDLNGIAVT